ncbi:MAG: double-strand break repair helicase AddA, partial [Hyphomicrobium sp.]
LKMDGEERQISEIFRETFSSINWAEHAKLFLEGSSADINRSHALWKVVHSKNDDEFTKNLYTIFFDTKDKPRKSFSTKGLQKKYPEIENIFLDMQSQFLELWRELKASELIEATLALYHLAASILQEYQIEKSRCGKLDFEDLIVRTKSLLFSREASQWVLYKLDSGLDHLLVDESQDTSLSQWMVIASLVQEFFSGEGSSLVDRTIFAVGDEKQSIYSFQGAAPQMFVDFGEQVKVLARQSKKRFEKINLNVSFRSTKPILETVDRIFSDPSRTPGVAHNKYCIEHISKRFNQAGSFEIWNKEFYSPGKISDPWSPDEQEISKSPIQRLASRIASTIEVWLQKGERLHSADRPIRPGDILILVRKRQPFADTMLMALKSRGIPVAGADRLRLKEHIIVQDLISLGQFILLPEDDLSLAEVLKSPIFGFDDDDLLKISVGRRNSLWAALLKNKDVDSRFSQAVELLKRWRNAADFMPPYEFWSSLLESHGVRSSLISRIGPEAVEPLDEFLSLALKYDSTAPASLTGFIQKILLEDREIKRDTETARDEVRIMTIHGAKGLEAPIVFLPDTCCSGRRREGSNLIKLKNQSNTTNENLPPFVWSIKGASHLSEIKDAKLYLEKQNKEEQERLLYVALTRARDKLIIGGFENKLGCSQDCWHALVCDMLALEIDPLENKKILYQNICMSSLNMDPDYKKNHSNSLPTKVEFPRWIKTKAPKEDIVCIPIKPSEMVPYISDFEEDPPEEQPSKSKLSEAGAPKYIRIQKQMEENSKDPFLRGKLTHSLLQYLPRISSRSWQETALRYVREKAPNMPTSIADNIIKETLDILADPNLGDLFGSASQSEVPIIATIPDPKGSKKSLRITGQIDRLAIKEKEILIVDFKTNRKPPCSPSEVSNIYIYQLAAYRIALLQIFNDRPVRAGLLWTETPKLMEIPVDILEKYTKDLWTLNKSDLDDKFYGF